MRLKNWHVVAIIVGCIIALIISGAIQYHYAQKQVEELTIRISVVELENKVLAHEYYELYEAVTPTHDLMMAYEKGE